METSFNFKGKPFVVYFLDANYEIFDAHRFKLASYSHYSSLCAKWSKYFLSNNMVFRLDYSKTDDSFYMMGKSCIQIPI